MTTFSDFNPAGTTRTSKRGIGRHVPLLPNHFNHRWFDAYVDDFLNKNTLENDGVVSGCVISRDGVNDAINITSGEVYIGGVRIAFTSPGTPYVCATDGWYIAYINNAGVVTYGLLENETMQGALTPDDSVVVGFAVRGNATFYLVSFFNEKDELARVVDETKHIQPTVTVGPALSNLRATHLETTFVAALNDGDKLLFLDSTTLTADRTLTKEVEVWMDGPDAKLSLGAFNLTFVEVSGKITATATSGKITLNGKTHGLIIIGSVTVEQGAGFIGSYIQDGIAYSKLPVIETPVINGSQLDKTGDAIDTAVSEVEAISGSLVGTSGVQTLTGKTFTSPVINSGISGTAISTATPKAQTESGLAGVSPIVSRQDHKHPAMPMIIWRMVNDEATENNEPLGSSGSDWEIADDFANEYPIGVSAVTESNGVFSVASTGYWSAKLFGSCVFTGSTSIAGTIESGTILQEISKCSASGVAGEVGNICAEILVKITDINTEKISASQYTDTNAYFKGSQINETYIVFEKKADLD